MPIDYVLAVVPVSEMATARPWYELLMGRPADNHPMDTLVEWRVVDGGWVQVFHDPERAGSTLLNFAVDDLDAHRSELAARGLAPGDIEVANKGVRLCAITDPDGNRITFIGGFRTRYG
ncbi:MAG TPA: VOC family protein [Acidimicrobiales bacterium]|nr:VOC family protein [Acidimicrobiales bacterium]